MARQPERRYQHQVESEVEGREIGPRQQEGFCGAGNPSPGVSADAAASIFPRDFTSITASTPRRRARMSISPEGQRHPRATMRHPRSRKCQRQSHSAVRPGAARVAGRA